MAKIYEVQDGGVRRDAPVMIRVIRICRNCGAKVFSDAPEGLCTGCVLEAAIGGAGDSSAVASAKADDRDSGKKDNANAAPGKEKTARAAELLGELGDYELLEESAAAVRAWYFAPGKRASTAPLP